MKLFEFTFSLLLFSLNIIEPADGKWGSRLSFSRWTGMVEQVRTGSVIIQNYIKQNVIYYLFSIEHVIPLVF